MCRHLNGYPDRPPVRPNISLGDSLAGLHAAFGAVMALHARGTLNGAGQVTLEALCRVLYATLLFRLQVCRCG